MRSSRYLVSQSLVLFASMGLAQHAPQTEAQRDGLLGAVKTVSTIVETSNVAWQQPSGPTLVIPALCRDCEYTPDGYHAKSGQVIDGKFVGETITSKRDGSGRVTDLLVTNTITRTLSRHEVLGPFGKIEQTLYQDGKLLAEQTFFYDGSGNLLETVSRDAEGELINRTLTIWSKDGGWSDETRGKDGQVESLNSFNPINDEWRSTTFDESGNVKQTWTLANGRVTSFWESPDAGSDSGIALSTAGGKSDVKSFRCRGEGHCDQALVHYEYADPAKQNPVSAEWRDVSGNLLYGAYYTYQFDESGNWTHHQVWVSSANTGEHVLYETDDRLITYLQN